MSFIEIVLISCGVFGGVVLAMAMGVIFGNRQIKGSCGGLAGMKDEHGNSMCDVCSIPVDECPDMQRETSDEKTASELERTH
ncbi:MAG: (Na+)-NQR maturation NqrM [Planctomycetaceae bacterium]|jgi:hypothetical protein|nr:(Na+)-NQR maturation NqrM [Planctomycetaceae bacterium]